MHIDGAQHPRHRRLRPDRLDDDRPAAAEPRAPARIVDPRQPGARLARQRRRRRCAIRACRSCAATSATPTPCARRCAGMDAVLHMAALRITACAADPREAHGGDVRRQLQRGRGGAAAPACGRCVAASSASVYGLAETFPTARGPSPVQQPDLVRRQQGDARRAAALVPRDVRPAVRGPALLQRLRAAHGHPRQVHRGADPLDGAHRRRPAAADPRRRPPDDGLRLHRRRRPRQRPGAAVRRRRTTCSTSPAAPRPSCASWPPRCSRCMGSELCSPSTARSAASTRCRAGWPTRRKAERLLGFRRQVGLDEGLRPAGATGGRPAAPDGGARMIPIAKPVMGEAGGRGGPPRHPERLDHAGPGGGGLRARVRRVRRRAARLRGLELHDGAAPGAAASPASAAATRSSRSATRSSPPPTASATAARRRCSSTSTRTPSTSTRR